ncbi:MAG: hypothetical protein KJ906_02405 [Nanoarchaeota archaeon]|nr:hypothetical protein [Nanoarchaeota archaeon]
MSTQLTQMGALINNVGNSITIEPNIEIMNSYALKKRSTIRYLNTLEILIEDSIENIENENLEESMKLWIGTIKKLEKNPFKQDLWSNYLTRYQKVIEITNGILADSIPDIQTKIQNEITAETCNYLIQSIELVRDVFSYFHSFANMVKKPGIINIIQNKSDIFKKLTDSFFEIVSYIQELIEYVENGKEMPEEFVEELINSFSSLNLTLLMAKSAVNITIEEVSISKEAEVILSGYSNPIHA